MSDIIFRWYLILIYAGKNSKSPASESPLQLISGSGWGDCVWHLQSPAKVSSYVCLFAWNFFHPIISSALLLFHLCRCELFSSYCSSISTFILLMQMSIYRKFSSFIRAAEREEKYLEGELIPPTFIGISHVKCTQKNSTFIMQIGITNVVPILKFNVHVSHDAVVRASRYLQEKKSNRITCTYYCTSSVFGGRFRGNWQSMWSGEEKFENNEIWTCKTIFYF